MKKNLFGNSKLLSAAVHLNDQVSLVHDACKICWDKPAEKDIEGKLKYIERRIKTGHESVIEHSNIIMAFEMAASATYLTHLAEILTSCKHLNTKVRFRGEDAFLLIGGSIRGYKHIFRTIENMSNPILAEIKNNLYSHSYAEFFRDFIDAGVMEEEKFNPDMRNALVASYGVTTASKRIEIVNADPIKSIHGFLTMLGFVDENGPIFSIDDLLDMCTVTVLFKDMSRTATHQLVRHRNGITQESQRYVDYSNAKFVSPEEFEEGYKDNEYTINLFGKEEKITMSNLGNTLLSIYEQLRKQNVLKQDARAFLPSNVACSKLYMTFTYRTLIKFLELRTDKAAQGEIREFANDLHHDFGQCFDSSTMYKYLMPKYMLSEVEYDYDKIDEVVEETEEEV